MTSTIQLRRDIASNWTANNPILHAGEVGIETNTGKIKIGNGSTAWNSLGYFTGDLSSLASVAFSGNSSDLNNDAGFVNASQAADAAPVQSVAGRTGAVTLSNTDISGLGTMSTQDASSVDITGGTITGMSNPTTDSDVATKLYVDNLVSGFTQKSIADAASTSNLNATYNNGTSGVGATLTNAGANGALVIDGVTLGQTTTVLVAGQTTQTQNGIYIVTTAGNGLTPWVLTRASYYDTSSEITSGDFVVVREGTDNHGTVFVNTTDPGTVVIGTTNIQFTLYQTPAQDLSGYVLKTTTVNGHALSGDVTVTKSDVGLGNVTNDAQLTAAQLSTDGTMASDSDSLVPSQKSVVTYVAAQISAIPSVNAGNLSGDTLASNVLYSSLTSLGTLTDLTVTNTITGSISGNAGTVTTINGQISNGSHISLSGTGTTSDPYVISSDASSTFAALTDVFVDGNNNMAAVNHSVSTSGSQNTGFGQNMFQNLTSGAGNSGFGAYAMQHVDAGSENTGIGNGALAVIDAGSENTGLGANAGSTLQTGNRNTVIGRSANVSDENAVNRIALGYNAVTTADNTAQIGNSSITDLTIGNGSAVLHAHAVTQTSGDNTTNIATTAFVTAAIGAIPAMDANSLTGTTLASNVVNSSLTSVGTLTDLTVTNTITGSVSGNAGTVTNGVYTTDTGTVTDTMLAGSISNGKLSHSSMTINGTSISLGDTTTITAAAGTLTGTTLNSTVTASSLTSVGTLTSLTVSGSSNLDNGAITTDGNGSLLVDAKISTDKVAGNYTVHTDGAGNLTANSFIGTIDGGGA